MKNNDDILSTDTTKIRHLINRVKQGKLDQGDALLIEKLLNFLLTIVSLLQRKHTSIRRIKELLFGMRENKRGKYEAKNRADGSRSRAEESSQTDSLKELASSSTCEGDSSTQEVRRLKRPGHGRKAASDYLGARLVRLNVSLRRHGYCWRTPKPDRSELMMALPTASSRERRQSGSLPLPAPYRPVSQCCLVRFSGVEPSRCKIGRAHV